MAWSMHHLVCMKTLIGMTSLLLLASACASTQTDTVEPSTEPIVDASVPERTAPPVLYESHSIDPIVAQRMRMQMNSREAVESASEAEGNEKLATPLVAPTLNDACGWDDPTLYFATGDADLGLIGEAKMAALASCLMSAPLEDESIVLVGHADARGDAYENLELGLERAQLVKSELVALGIEPTRIETYSRGEYRVDGDDSDLDDRRVVVKLDQ